MKLDLTGQRFGKLTVIEESEKWGHYTTWLCKCDCGNEKKIRTNSLRSGATKSCGCESIKALQMRKIKYKNHNYRMYHVWYGMLERCKNQKNTFYHRYGGRGITVCNEWKDFDNFANWALQNGYDDALSLDRIDNDGNYSPSNCRWVTKKQQHNNTSTNRFETIDGVTKTIAEWADEYGIRYGLLRRRLDRGMSIKDALTTERKWLSRGVPVRCVDTGEIFKSSKSAGEKYGVTTGAIARAARLGKKSCGMRWEQVHGDI